MRSHRISVVLILFVCLLAAACASTTLGKAIQGASVQKQLVERAAIEIIKLHLQGKISDHDYQIAKETYQTWAKGQTALAQSLAAWKTVSSVENSQRLEVALSNARDVSQSFLDFAARFIDLKRIQQAIGG
jgi:hypothetical protein